METEKIISEFYKGKLVFREDLDKYYENAQKYYSEETCKKLDQCIGSRKEVSEKGKSNFFLENVTTFSEVKKYKGINLADMNAMEHRKAVESIINQISEFDINPVGYEVKKDAVVFCWYVMPVLRAFPDYVILLPEYFDHLFGGEFNEELLK